jgi:YebC/PmpR family DNA-binding regulatory protein
MAGHSKWANIKHRKGAADAKRGKVFSKIAKEIMVVARQGGGDPAANITLRSLIAKARSVNMPADNIDRAIKKGTGELDDGSVFEEIVYEGFAGGGVGILVAVLTDNRNRSTAEVRHCFTKNNLTLGTQGSVSRSFNRKGLITVPAEGIDEEELMELAIENGAEDFERDGDSFSITTDPNSFMDVMDALEAKGIPTESSEITLLPDMLTPVTEADDAKKVMNFVEALDDLDDVQNVYHNMDVDDAIMEQLAAEE